jgi:hypothetical protein
VPGSTLMLERLTFHPFHGAFHHPQHEKHVRIHAGESGAGLPARMRRLPISRGRAEHEERGVFEEQVGLGLVSEPPPVSWLVVPARLDCVVRQVHLVVAGHVLAEHEGEPVGKRLRVGSADAEHASAEVL